jgi:hypothetical protein
MIFNSPIHSLTNSPPELFSRKASLLGRIAGLADENWGKSAGRRTLQGFRERQLLIF